MNWTKPTTGKCKVSPDGSLIFCSRMSEELSKKRSGLFQLEYIPAYKNEVVIVKENYVIMSICPFCGEQILNKIN